MRVHQPVVLRGGGGGFSDSQSDCLTLSDFEFGAARKETAARAALRERRGTGI